MNKWKAVLACMTVCATVAVGTNVPAGSGRANAGASKADFSEAPVLVSTDVKRSGSESMRVELDSAVHRDGKLRGGEGVRKKRQSARRAHERFAHGQRGKNV